MPDERSLYQIKELGVRGFGFRAPLLGIQRLYMSYGGIAAIHGFIYMYVYIYIHISRKRERERDRNRERDRASYIYIYI